MSTPTTLAELYTQDPGALKQFHAELERRNETRPLAEQVTVKSLEELQALTLAVPDSTTAILVGRGRPDTFDDALVNPIQ